MPGEEKKDQVQQRKEQKLDLSKETLKDLDAQTKDDVKGGVARTSFSCGNLCISINAC